MLISARGFQILNLFDFTQLFFFFFDSRVSYMAAAEEQPNIVVLLNFGPLKLLNIQVIFLLDAFENTVFLRINFNLQRKNAQKVNILSEML